MVLSSAGHRSGMSPPAVFIDSSIHGDTGSSARRRIFICIAHFGDSENRGLLRRFELEMDDGAESPLSPLVEYSNGASIDVSAATANSSFSSSSSVLHHKSVPSSSSEKHGSLLVDYHSCRLRGTDNNGSKMTSNAGFATCVHWCSHSEVAVGLAGGGILFAEFGTDDSHNRMQQQQHDGSGSGSRVRAPVVLSERIFISTVDTVIPAAVSTERTQAAPAGLRRLWSGIMGATGATSVDVGSDALSVQPPLPPGTFAETEAPTISLSSFHLRGGRSNGDESESESESARCCLVALTSSGLLRVWDTGSRNDRRTSGSAVFCSDGCLLEAAVSVVVKDCPLAADAAQGGGREEPRRLLEDLRDARISALVVAGGQAAAPSLKIAVALAPRKRAEWCTFVLSAEAPRVGSAGDVVGMGSLSCSCSVERPRPPADIVATKAACATATMLDLQLHPCVVGTGSGGGSGSPPLFLVAAWEWDWSPSTAIASGGVQDRGQGQTRSAVAACDVTAHAQGKPGSRGLSQQSPASLRMALVPSAATGSADYATLAAEDAAVCDAILAAGVDSWTQAGAIEAKLQTALMQRVFLPGRFQLGTVAASIDSDVPASCRPRKSCAPSRSHRCAGDAQLLGAVPTTEIDTYGAAEGGSTSRSGASLAALADAVLQSCRQWASLRQADSAHSSGQLMAQLQGNGNSGGARNDLSGRYSAEQLQWLECLVTVCLEFIERCERRAATLEGLTRGCLQRHDVVLGQADTEVPAFFCSSTSPSTSRLTDEEAAVRASRSLAVAVARRTSRVSCVTLPYLPGVPAASRACALSDLLDTCGAAVGESAYLQFDSYLQQFLHEHAVVHADALHQSISRRVGDLARSIQHVYSEARTRLHHALALAHVGGNDDDEAARLRELFGAKSSSSSSGSFARVVGTHTRIPHATSISCRLLLQTASREVASAYRAARDRAVTLALLLAMNPADSQLSGAAIRVIQTELYPQALVWMLHWALLQWLDRVRPVDMGSTGDRGGGSGSDEGGNLFEEAAELSQYYFCGSLRAGKTLVSEVRRLALAHRLHHPLASSTARLQSPTPTVSIWRHFCHFSVLSTAGAGTQGYDSASMARAMVDDCRLANISGLLRYLEAAGQYSALSRAASVALLAAPWTHSHRSIPIAAADALGTTPSTTVEDAGAVIARDRLAGAVAFAQVMEGVRTLTAVTTTDDTAARIRNVVHKMELLIAVVAGPRDGGDQWLAPLTSSQEALREGCQVSPTAIVAAMTSVSPATSSDVQLTSVRYRVARICETSDALVVWLSTERGVCAAVARGDSELVAEAVLSALRRHPALFLRLHRAAHLHEALELAKRIGGSGGFLTCAGAAAISQHSGAVGTDGLLAGLALRASYALAYAVDESLRLPAQLQAESSAFLVHVQLCVEQAIAWSRVFEYALECHSLDEALDAVLRLLHIEAAWPEGVAPAVRSRLALLGAENWSWRACLGALVLRACDSGSLCWLCSLGEAVAGADVPADPRQGQGRADVAAASSLAQAIGQELRSLANSITMSTVVGRDQGPTSASPWTLSGTGEATSRGAASYSECLCAFLLSRQQFREAASVMYTESRSAELRATPFSSSSRSSRVTPPAAALAVSAAALSAVRPSQGLALIRHADSVKHVAVQDISALLQCSLLEAGVGACADDDDSSYLGARVRKVCSNIVDAAERGDHAPQGGACEDRLAAALHLALHVDDQTCAAAAVSATASSAVVLSAEPTTYSAAAYRAFSPLAGCGLGGGEGAEGRRGRSAEARCALYDSLAFLDRPAAQWALHRAALEGTLELSQAPAPLLQALCCATIGDGIAGTTSNADSASSMSHSNSPSAVTEGHISVAMRSLIAHGRLVQACQLAAAVLTAWDKGATSSSTASGCAGAGVALEPQSHAPVHTSAVPYNAIDAVLKAAANTIDVYQHHHSRLADATKESAGSSKIAATMASAEWKSLQLHHSQLDRILRRHFARLLSAELKQ